eukprot:scaffold3504_cov240-Pinguiococcus_pyrenoidosus.AAC.18
MGPRCQPCGLFAPSRASRFRAAKCHWRGSRNADDSFASVIAQQGACLPFSLATPRPSPTLGPAAASWKALPPCAPPTRHAQPCESPAEASTAERSGTSGRRAPKNAPCRARWGSTSSGICSERALSEKGGIGRSEESGVLPKPRGSEHGADPERRRTPRARSRGKRGRGERGRGPLHGGCVADFG